MNIPFIPNYSERYDHGEEVSTAVAESTVNEVISRRMAKKTVNEMGTKKSTPTSSSENKNP